MNAFPSARQQRTLLIRHFLKHFFNSELIPRQAEAKVTLIQILALVSVPGFVIMCMLLRKYARLLPLSPPAAHLASLNEKCLFLYFSMVVIGFVAVLEWDTLFPDRRDYLILSPLPIRETTMFVAKAASLCVFLVLFSVFVNAFTAILYPLFASSGLLQAVRFIISHAVSVFAGNAFIFFSCIALQGFLLNIFGPGLFVRISRFVQLFLLVSFLSVFFLMPAVSYESLRQHPTFLNTFAPAWFLGLYETLLVGPTSEFLPLAYRALSALGLASLGFALSYILAYRRQLRRTLSAGSARRATDSALRRVVPALSHRFLLRSPKERALFGFIAKTLARSQPHRTYFGAYLGVGLAFVVMGLVTLFSRHGAGSVHVVRSELLSIPLVLSFFMLLGLRVVFSVPAHLAANWVFRLTDGQGVSDCLSGVRKAMLVLGIFPLIIFLLPFYVMWWGWPTASLHMAYCTILAVLLIEILLFRLDRIPFTCTYTPGRANLKLWWPAYLFGLTNYAYTMTELEQRLLPHPTRFLPFFAVSLALLLAVVRHRNRSIARLSTLRYESDIAPAAEPLSLGYRPF